MTAAAPAAARPSASDRKVNGPVKLGDRPALHAALRQTTLVAIGAGEFKGRRGLPEEIDSAVWIGKESRPLAFITFSDAGYERVWLDLIYVRPSHRRQHLAAAMVLVIERIAKLYGYQQIVLGTRLDNAAMRAAGARLGFAETHIHLTKDIAPQEARSAAGATGKAPAAATP